MLSLAQPQCSNALSQNLHFPFKTRFPFFPNRSSNLNFRAFHGKTRTGLWLNAFKTKKNRDFSSIEIVGPDEFDDEFVDDIESDEDFSDDDDGASDDEVVIPLRNMKKWLESKPRGFGEGKVYDTLIEDKLMEEIEQSRKAQLTNVNKLKNNPVKPISQKGSVQQIQGSTPVQDGFRVRLVNLPKKMNIHKDLQLAFKGVPGIININPVVFGNKKTRDPICKGLAFVDFKSVDDADRFLENFSGQSVNFGKVQKKIKCEATNFNLSKKPAGERSADKMKTTSQQTVLSFDQEMDADVDANVASSDSWEESPGSESDEPDERYVSAQWEDSKEVLETSSSQFDTREKEWMLESSSDEDQEVRPEMTTNSSSKKKERKLPAKNKKAPPRGRKDKTPKLNVPGAAKRLKIREKAVLTGVFSKYGGKTTSAVKEKS